MTAANSPFLPMRRRNKVGAIEDKLDRKKERKKKLCSNSDALHLQEQITEFEPQFPQVEIRRILPTSQPCVCARMCVAWETILREGLLFSCIHLLSLT